MLSQEITESPTANHLQQGFFVKSHTRKCVHQKFVCEFINTFSCHSECITGSTLILTPYVNRQVLLIRISTDENLRYIVLFKTFPAM